MHAKTLVTFSCDRCNEQETVEKEEGYETNYGEPLPKYWRWFLVAFTIAYGDKKTYLLCGPCSGVMLQHLQNFYDSKGIWI